MVKPKTPRPKGVPQRRGSSAVSTVALLVRVTPGERRRYKAMAKRLQMTLSDLVRTALGRLAVVEKQRMSGRPALTDGETEE